jgi:ubiquinone/menaquinone biosynthesis C-methylase UbiE
VAREAKNRLVNSIVESALREAAARYAHGRLIDIGCGEKPYRSLFAPYVAEHIGVDHVDTQHAKHEIDLVGTAYAIPVADRTFDTALCTAVLEHLEEPEVALRECYRVLAPGGHAIYVAPLFWHLHEDPRDFYRYTKYGLEYLFRKAGLELVELKPLSGFWVTWAQMAAYYVDRANRGFLRRLRLIDALTFLIQAAAYVLERVDRSERWTWSYLVVATRR